MIIYRKDGIEFSFASPPRTGTTWFMKACSMLGFGDGFKAHAHTPPPENWKGITVSMVRHPYDWLVSYYEGLKGGVIGVGIVDTLVPVARNAGDVYSFVRHVSNVSGAVETIFDNYQATNVLKLEDLPWCALEFFESLSINRSSFDQIHKLTPQNVRKGFVHVRNKDLRERIYESERPLCDRYEYGS